MPEEINRIVADEFSRFCFVTEESGMKNLAFEGIDDDRVFFVGNTMIDSVVKYLGAARDRFPSIAERLGIASPKIIVSGLNPHAGEQGAMGAEESRIIGPAITALKEAGIDVRGPSPADTLFHPAARETYDVAICMYHDQALIPIKTINFSGGVNVTLGLPFVRTSPDHGTALDIAGTGKADPASLIAAIDMADEMARRRQT